MYLNYSAVSVVLQWFSKLCVTLCPSSRLRRSLEEFLFCADEFIWRKPHHWPVWSASLQSVCTSSCLVAEGCQRMTFMILEYCRILSICGLARLGSWHGANYPRCQRFCWQSARVDDSVWQLRNPKIYTINEHMSEFISTSG